MPAVLIPLAEGCEELEAVTIIDLLRRADISVITASLGTLNLTASRGTHLMADTELDNVIYNEFDMVVLPGGLPGADNLNNDHRVHAVLKRVYQEGGAVAAICAAPRVLAKSGLATGKTISCYPGSIDSNDWPNISITDKAVVVDDRIITSRGPGTAMDFALTLIEYLNGRTTRDQVENALVR